MSSIGLDESGLLRDAFATPDLVERSNVRWSNDFQNLLKMCEIATDLLAVSVVFIGTVLGMAWWHAHRFNVWPTRDSLLLALIASAAFMFLLDREGAYRRASSLLRVRETECILRATVLAACLLVPVVFIVEHESLRWFAIAIIVAPLVVISEKHGLYCVVRSLYRGGYGTRRVLIYGAGLTGRRVFSAIARSPKLGMECIGIVDDDPSRDGEEVRECAYSHAAAVPVLCRRMTREWFRERNVAMLIIAIPSVDRTKFLQVANEAAAAGVEVAFVPNHAIRSDYRVEYEEFDGVLLASFSRANEKPGYEFVKRGFDLVIGGLLLVLLAPAMLIISIVIKLDSRGPALFRQQRVGKKGEPFTIFKFRTMYSGVPAYEPSPSDSSDRRITKAGRFLRRASFDEIPQIINVVRGEMSLVGPRPEMPFIVERYTRVERERLEVMPGITGLWQLSADRAFMIHENIQYDLYYIRHRNFFMDAAILLHTLVFAMRGI
jgi:exopolysaccharide biosynthesis polyprenyl glycosylphosphotransferase